MNIIHFIPFEQVGRVSNPFGSTLTSIIVFGSQLLALTEDGERMLIWDTAGGGKQDHSLAPDWIAQLTFIYFKRCAVNDSI
jgi:hypothetical protein